MRRFLGFRCSDTTRYVLVDRVTGQWYLPNPELVDNPELVFEERWMVETQKVETLRQAAVRVSSELEEDVVNVSKQATLPWHSPQVMRGLLHTHISDIPEDVLMDPVKLNSWLSELFRKLTGNPKIAKEVLAQTVYSWQSIQFPPGSQGKANVLASGGKTDGSVGIEWIGANGNVVASLTLNKDQKFVVNFPSDAPLPVSPTTDPSIPNPDNPDKKNPAKQ